MKKILGLLFNLFVGVLFAQVLGGGAYTAIGIGTTLSLMPSFLPSGVLPMAIQVEIWEADIIEGLWADNSFLNYAYNADQYVLSGKVVHIPQAGAAPAAKTNRSTLPATVTQRTDVDITYAIDEITTDPVLIPNADSIELSYDKRLSVTAESRAAAYEAAALNIFYRWSPTIAGHIIRTTGSAVPAHTPSATGNRKAFALSDLKKAEKQMNRDNVPSKERYALFDADMYDQLTEGMSANQQRDFLAAYDEKSGVVGRLYGFNIMMRSRVARYDNATTPAPKKWGVAGGATDNAAVLCWQKNSLERALGDVKFFEKLGDPTYYGDIYSTLIRLGGRIRRDDCKGVVAIVQATIN